MILQKDTSFKGTTDAWKDKINRGSGRILHHHSTSRPWWEEHCVLQMPWFSASVYTSKWPSQHITLYEVGFQFRCYFREHLKMYQYKLFQLSIPKNDWHWLLSGLPPYMQHTPPKLKEKQKGKKSKQQSSVLQHNLCWPLHNLKGWVWNTLEHNQSNSPGFRALATAVSSYLTATKSLWQQKRPEESPVWQNPKMATLTTRTRNTSDIPAALQLQQCNICSQPNHLHISIYKPTAESWTTSGILAAQSKVGAYDHPHGVYIQNKD